MLELLTSAIEMHQAGQLGAAAQLYQKVLAGDGANAVALHMLGVLHHQQGDHARAVELIGQAVALQPNAPAFHANLAEAYRAMGQLERAIGCCRAAINLRPNFPEALCNLGLALQGLGRRTEAIDQFRQALKFRPDFAQAHNNLGVALRESGQGDLALGHFTRAVELDPGFAPARTNLGQMLLDRGKTEDALTHCREAVARQPDVAAFHHNLGNVLRDLNRLVEARSSYLEALRLAPELAQPHAQMGLILQKEGKLADALHWLERAVELAPKDATFWEALAELRAEREEFAEAVPCWQRVLALAEKDRPGPHLSLGWALQEEGRLTEAGEQYRIALALQPDSAPAQLNMGGLYEELGELTQAEAAFRKARELQPNLALASARLANLLRGKLNDVDLSSLEARLADPNLDSEPRSHLLFALAGVLDSRGDYTRAAYSAQAANSLRLELARNRREYNPDDHRQLVDNLLKEFTPEFFRKFCDAGLDTSRPVFVFGLPRSGTTLIEQILASHPRVHGAGELRLARQSLESIPKLLGRAEFPLPCIPHLDGRTIRQLAHQHLDALEALAPAGADRIVDKMPDNYMYLGLLAVLFPGAVFIHCRRDLRDVAVSCWLTDFRSIRWASHFDHISSRVRHYRRLMEHWRACLPVPIHEVHYEETVADLEGVARRLIAACRLEWNPACIAFHTTRRPVRTASITQVRQPIYMRSVARWKNYDRELAELFAALPVETNETDSPTSAA
jgi:tetratricopeptide (TPR) repeat protein